MSKMLCYVLIIHFLIYFLKPCYGLEIIKLIINYANLKTIINHKSQSTQIISDKTGFSSVFYIRNHAACYIRIEVMLIGFKFKMSYIQFKVRHSGVRLPRNSATHYVYNIVPTI